MFKKLKDKIAEEVKISPQRMQQLQQFTQTMSDKLTTTTTTSSSAPVDNGLFSIAEDEQGGFTPVSLHASSPDAARRNSASSVASDVSFLPRYDPSRSQHVEPDLFELDVSEMEDNVSTHSSSQLGHVSKEQLHTAFQKAQMRYHKYRGRFTDVANHYRELERDKAKLQSMLVETQDKAIKRVNELKEQCVLGQKAKADLESALRTELEEKEIVIQSLRQKIDLLQSDMANSTSAEMKAASIVARERLATRDLELAACRRDLETALKHSNDLQVENVNLAATSETLRRHHADEIADLQTTMKQSLVDFQAKMKEAMCAEHAQRESEMKAEFERKLRALEANADGDSNVQLMQAKETAAAAEVTLKKNELELDALRRKHDVTEQNYVRLLEEHAAMKATSEQQKCDLLKENAQLTKAHEELQKRRKLFESLTELFYDTENAIEMLSESFQTLENDLDAVNTDQEREMKTMEAILETTQVQLQQEQKANEKLAEDARQISELEQHVSELQQERQLLREEIEELKTAPLQAHADVAQLQQRLQQYRSVDQSQRTSIEYYESELEKVHAKNAKLKRTLDETLVTLQHCNELSAASTEGEYLRNVLYNYMLGKEGVVLARVIAAVCKFDRAQTEDVLKHEQQKQTILGQLGIL